MKKTTKLLIVCVMLCTILVTSLSFVSCNKTKDEFKVGVCQLVQHVALDAATLGFKESLEKEMEKAGKKVTIDIQNASGDAPTCTTIVNSFVSGNYDLIMANATPALQAAVNSTLKIPVLGTSITEYGVALGIKDFNGTVGTNVSGTSDLAPLDKQADMFAELLPQAKKIGILYCSAEANSVYQANVVKAALEGKNAGYQVKIYTFTDSNDINAVLNLACTESDALYIPTDNTAASNTEIIDQVATEKNVPIIAGEEGIATGCGIATLSISYYNIGAKTGKMAADILLGKSKIETMAIQYDEAPVYKYSAVRCEKYGITVPENYQAIV